MLLDIQEELFCVDRSRSEPKLLALLLEWGAAWGTSGLSQQEGLAWFTMLAAGSQLLHFKALFPEDMDSLAACPSSPDASH